MAQKIKGNGRYSESDILTYTNEKNVDIQYISRRFIPQKDTQKILGAQEVQTGDRPDLLAYRAYGNSCDFYHLADYNLSMNPFSMSTTVGRLIVVPMKTT